MLLLDFRLLKVIGFLFIDNFTQTRIDMSESVDDSEITNPTQTEHIGDG